jgi:CheY-like chemotaxis protein
MENLKILLVEDAEDQQKIFAASVGVFNDKNKDICVVEYEVANDLSEALRKMNGSFDGVIADLKLGNDDDGGNTVVSKFGEMLARIPVIFVTGFVDLVEDHPSVIHKRARGDSSYEADILKFKQISDTGLTRIMGGRGKIETALSDVFLKNLLPQIEKWVVYGANDSSRTEKALLRFTLNHLRASLKSQY